MKNVNAIILFFFLAHWPSLNFFFENIEKNPKFLPVILVGSATFFLLLVLYFFFSFFLKIKKEIACGVLFILTFWFFLFSIFVFLIDIKFEINFPVTIFWFLSLLGALFVFSFIKNKILFSKVLLYVSLALFVTPILQIIFFKSVYLKTEDTKKNYYSMQIKKLDRFEKEKLSNVFFILVDSYVRRDVIFDLYGFDNIEFINFLDKEGFVTPSQSFSNYRFTAAAMPSLFMMNYVHKLNVDNSDIPFINDGKLQDEIITGYNAVVKKFKSLGYNYIHGGGARPCDIKTSYKCLLNYENIQVPLDVGRIIQTTPIPFILTYIPNKKLEKIFLNYQKDFTINDFESRITEITESPYFLYYHTMELHEVIYDKNCNIREEVYMHQTKRFLNLSLGNHNDHYITTLNCVNNSLQKLIKKISLLNKDPIIIIASDHVPPYLVLEKPIHFDVNKDFGVHLSIKLPEKCKFLIPEKISNINLFRLVFACIEGKEPNFIEDKFFFADQDLKRYRKKTYIDSKLKNWTEFKDY